MEKDRELGEALRRALHVRDLLMMAIGATLVAFAGVWVPLGFAQLNGQPECPPPKADRIDTFNGRWMPLLPPPPQIRTDPPHCVLLWCRVV